MRASIAGSEGILRPAQGAIREEVPTRAAERSLKYRPNKEELVELWQQQRVEPEQRAVGHTASSSEVS